MDFNPRGSRPVVQEQQAPNNQVTQNEPTHPAPTNKSRGGGRDIAKMMSFLMLIATAVLAIGVVGLLAFGTPTRKNNIQAEAVKASQYQAVFLNGGQVYFGKIFHFSDKVIGLKDIFYLRVNQQVQPGQADQQNANNISLAKLGSELHGPEDSMYINVDEVQFWENLKDDGQVVKAITAYKENPEAANQQQTQATEETTTPTNSTPANTNNTNTTNTNNPTNQR
ncbi:MAG: hypothetical protein M3Q79_02730 [bacterium]|nr:hypothetical protein [bacterium]